MRPCQNQRPPRGKGILSHSDVLGMLAGRNGMMSVEYLRGLGRLVASKSHVATIQIPIGYKGCSSGQHSRSSVLLLP